MGGRGAGGGGKAGGGGGGGAAASREDNINKIRTDMRQTQNEMHRLRVKRRADKKIGLPIDPKASKKLSDLQSKLIRLQSKMRTTIGQ